MIVPRLLVFDLDGTLIDSSTDLCNSVNAALHHVGRQKLAQATIASFIGDGAATLVRRALDEATRVATIADGGFDDVFPVVYRYFLDYYRAHKLDNTLCYDGVVQALTQIRSAHLGLPMAILTNKPVKPSREICSALGIERFFFQNYGGNSFESKKPDPTGFMSIVREASSLLGSVVNPEEAVMIGDSDVDVMTARRSGARSLGCAFGLAPYALAAAGPDITVAHPSEWKAALGL